MLKTSARLWTAPFTERDCKEPPARDASGRSGLSFSSRRQARWRLLSPCLPRIYTKQPGIKSVQRDAPLAHLVNSPFERQRHSVSGVRVGEDLSSLLNSCSANCQNSASRSSGRPACSQSLYARASISCLFGSGIMIAPGWSTVPPFRGLGAYRQDRARPAWRLAGGFKST